MKTYIVIFLALLLSAPALAQQPRIDSIAIDEDKGELILHGDFQNSVSAVVTVDSVSLTVVLASDTLLRATIPVSGKGSCGTIQVRIQSNKSNTRLLTYFHFRIKSIFSHLYSNSYLEEAINDNAIHVRIDLSKKEVQQVSCSKASVFHALADGISGIGYDSISLIIQNLFIRWKK